MNDPDGSPSVNAGWTKSGDQFIALGEEYGVTPILSTVPNVPTNVMTFKNDIVMKSGYRYIDFASAVGALNDSTWYPNMIYSDNVHPASLGAKAAYARAIVDFPELTR